VFLGSAQGLATTPAVSVPATSIDPSSGDVATYGSAFLGDVNGDGLSDFGVIVTGSYTYEGSPYPAVYLGTGGTISATPAFLGPVNCFSVF
jgi:hypothetical protein